MKTGGVVNQPHTPEEAHSPRNGDRRPPANDDDARGNSRDTHTSENDRREDEFTTTAASSTVDQAASDQRGSLRRTDAAAGGMRAPYNPFARTLASREAGFGLSEDSRETAEGGGRENEQRAKPALDVDAFKNILMTGAPIPTGLSTHLGTPRPHHITTEAPAAYDAAYGAHPESPRDIHHDYDSTSEDDEKSELMGIGRSEDLAPPAPPKPKTKGPQTVSFADFDQSIPPGFVSSRSRSPHINAQHLTGILRSASPRPGSDLNKPLPAPPTEPTEKSSPALADASGPLPRADVQSPTTSSSAKPIPPPPPTRKSGAGHGRARSSSNLSNMTTDSASSTPADSGPSMSSNKLAPPPPPTRKSGNHSTAQPQAKGPSSPHPEARLTPPPPPPLRRLSSRSARGTSNLGRQASEDGSSMAETTPAPTTSAPPPPPPRRPGSKRTSLDGAPSSFPRRLSGEYYRGTSFDSERPPSISSLQKVAEGSEGSEQASMSPGAERDILAEMSAFQAEIDALSQAAKAK